MVLMLLAGAAVGTGVLVMARSLTPARPDLAVALERLNRPAAIVASAPEEAHRVLVSLARALGLDRLITGSVDADLRLLGRNRESHLARCLLVGFESALIAPALAAVLAIGGVHLPVVMPLAFRSRASQLSPLSPSASCSYIQRTAPARTLSPTAKPPSPSLTRP